jgi:hypothetical protein
MPEAVATWESQEEHHSHVHPHAGQPERAEILLLPFPLGNGLLAHMIEFGEIQAEGVEQGRGEDDDEADDGVLSRGQGGNTHAACQAVLQIKSRGRRGP